MTYIINSVAFSIHADFVQEFIRGCLAELVLRLLLNSLHVRSSRILLELSAQLPFHNVVDLVFQRFII